jgi:deazaflavin-dependent oxidoreductase (nitroreductase family)
MTAPISPLMPSPAATDRTAAAGASAAADTSSSGPATTGGGGDRRYLRPGRITRFVMNPVVAAMTRLGIGFAGARTLEVRGRRSGQLRTTPVNVLSIDGVDHLVAPRGETEWVRNLRVAGTATLRLGRRTVAVTATEVPDADKTPDPAPLPRPLGVGGRCLLRGRRRPHRRRRTRRHRPRFPRVPPHPRVTRIHAPRPQPPTARFARAVAQRRRTADDARPNDTFQRSL